MGWGHRRWRLRRVAVNPDIKLGICGEHGGEPSSIAFCHRVGLTYVSCKSLPSAGGPIGCRLVAALNLGDGPPSTPDQA